MSKKICFVVTVSMTVDQFLRFGFEKFHANGFEVHVIADMDEDYVQTLPEYVHALPLKMSRGIDPRGLFSAISQMTQYFKQEKFDIVQYSTPNASLYASVAAKRAKIPVRLYCQWGMVYLGFTGLKRTVFKTIEKTVCRLSTDVQPDSKGNLEFCRKNKFYNEEKSRIVWNGSANGLDLKKYDYRKREQFRKEIRQQYGIADDTVVLGFLGRVGRDKGFNELMSAFRLLNEKYKNIKLLYVGPNEKPDTVDPHLLAYFDACEDIIYTGGWVDDTERYYAAMDVFLFPSYREGFGSVVIEAESMGVPVVVTDIPGPQNGMVEGVTGFKVPPKTVEPLVEKASLFIENKQLREQCGEAAAAFAAENFDSEVLLEKIIENRNWLLQRNKPASNI